MSAPQNLDDIFSPAENRTLAAALDRIIPADDFPSACEAGVLDYLERQFRTDLAGQVTRYHNGLAALDRQATELFGSEFYSLEPERQDAILKSAAVAVFVDMLSAHAAEGYYGDPGNGCNRDCAAWRMVGFDAKWSAQARTE